MIIFLSIVGTLMIIWGIIRGLFSVLGADMAQVIASAIFALIGVACIGTAIFVY